MQPSTPPLYRPSPLRASTTIPLRPSSPIATSLPGSSSLSGRPVQNPYATAGAESGGRENEMEEPDGVKVGEIGGGIAALGDGEDAIREYEEKRDR